jgi:hypothetical protein
MRSGPATMPYLRGRLSCQDSVHVHPAVTCHGKGKLGSFGSVGFARYNQKTQPVQRQVSPVRGVPIRTRLAADRGGDINVSRLLPSYETRITHRGAMALVGQKSLHLKQPMHDWACTGSALWCAILNTPMEQRSTQIPQPLQKIRSTYTSIKIDGEGPTSTKTSLIRFHSLVTNKFDCNG